MLKFIKGILALVALMYKLTFLSTTEIADLSQALEKI